MILNKETVYTQDVDNKKIKVVREFDAPVEKVWKAWTEQELLDQWWAPKPWKAVTQSMDFRTGGTWRYYMQGPDGSRHYCLVNYDSIVPNKSFAGLDAFCDENGMVVEDFPQMHWDCRFGNVDDGTKVEVEISFNSKEAMDKIIEMGFKEGFASAHNNLDELLAESLP
jgi:uncharacterized protein YndB with AHSA1/START domain